MRYITLFVLFPISILARKITDAFGKIKSRSNNDLSNNARTSYRNGRNTEALIFENLEPVEITKRLFQHHLNILKCIKFQN